ncbi:Transient receptor putative cation channel sub V member 6 [Rhizoclosmatium sp. JEL0117]|nr:Transient receptor putative cation channel sub V member 6 [Rhizoclosmatium sp. JEL0117]
MQPPSSGSRPVNALGQRFLHRHGTDYAASANVNHHGSAHSKPATDSVAAQIGQFVSLVFSGGESVGAETISEEESTKLSGDLLRTHMLEQEHSLWSILLRENDGDFHLTPHEFMAFYHKNKRSFFAKHGFDMLLERGPNGESILCHVVLYKKMSLLKFMLGVGFCSESGIAYDDLPFNPIEAPKGGLTRFPRLHQIANMVYEGPTYHGEHVAHIMSVVFQDKNDDSDPIQLQDETSAVFWIDTLIRKAGADVAIPRAQGSFFSQQELYLGETVLAFAACMGNKKLVKYLVLHAGVDPNQRDSYNNNVLHVLCFWGLYEDGMLATMDADGPAKTQSRIKDDGRVTQIISIKDDSIFAFLCSKRTQYSFKGDKHLSEEELQRYEEEIQDLRITADDLAMNSQGDTPFLVAVRRGNVDMVQAYLDYKRTVMWTFGPIELARYSVTEIDTYIDRDSMNHSVGALTLAVRLNHIPIINLPIFRKLLDSKWILYAKYLFWRDFILHLGHMFLFTVMIALLPNGYEYTDPNRYGLPNRILSIPLENTRDAIRFVTEIALIAINIGTVVDDIVEYRHVKENFSTGFGGAERLTTIGRVALFFAGVVCRLTGQWQAENIIWGLSALVGWGQVFFYTRGFENLGPLIIVLYRIIKDDVPNFMRLALLFIVAFGEALWLQMAPWGDMNTQLLNAGNSTANVGGAEWKTMPGGLWWSLRNFLIVNSSPYSDIRNSPVRVLGIGIFLIFVFLANYLLINVFIAMVGDTFSKVTGEATNQWLLSRAHLIMQYDEKILSHHYDEVNAAKAKRELEAAKAKQNKNLGEKNKDEDAEDEKAKKDLDELPEHLITRIGVPRPYLSEEIAAYNLVDSSLGTVRAFHHTKCYYELLMEVEKRNNQLLIKRVIATTDKNSPLHESNRYRNVKTTQTHDAAWTRSRRAARG